jgi:hypothetical protein
MHRIECIEASGRKYLWVAKNIVHVCIATDRPALQRLHPIDGDRCTQIKENVLFDS